MKKLLLLVVILCLFSAADAQLNLNWQNVDSLYGPLPRGIHVFKTTDSIEGKPNIAFYVKADLKSKDLLFSADTTYKRRLTPAQFFEKNNRPLLVVNCTFFSFETNSNLNSVINKGRQLSYSNHLVAGRGKDTLTYYKMLRSAIGISKNRKADVAWLYTDSVYKYPIAFENGPMLFHDSLLRYSKYSFAPQLHHFPVHKKKLGIVEKWKMQTAVGGGPVLLQNGKVKITNEEEKMFTGKGISDKHPRTAMGYTADGHLIILVVQGRFNGIAEGATLGQEAHILKSLSCVEALNLDGGGSSCLLINGKETITPSDKGLQRAVPAVFMIQNLR